MKTVVTDSIEEAAAYIRAGSIAAFPTETVYGLGADAMDSAAVRQIFVAKGRPADNPLIVHLADALQIDQVAAEVSEEAQGLVEAFFPGPLTIVLQKSDRIVSEATAGLNTVGVRVPSHPVAHEFLRACGRPVAAPSANRSGRPSPTTWQAVLEDLDGRIPCILRGGRSTVGLESTVVDCSTSPPRVLRVGAVSVEALKRIVPAISVLSEDGALARSPGTRYRHYAPGSRVIPVRGIPNPSSRAAFIGLDEPPAGFGMVRVCESIEQYAHELFDFFRACDAAGIEDIYCQEVDERGLGRALMDRIRRAATPHP